MKKNVLWNRPLDVYGWGEGPWGCEWGVKKTSIWHMFAALIFTFCSEETVGKLKLNSNFSFEIDMTCDDLFVRFEEVFIQVLI